MLELNAHPERVDLLDTYCRMARDEDVLVSINSNAYSVLEFDNQNGGIGQAQRGWFLKDDVLNIRPLSELKRLFAQRPIVIFGAAGCALNGAATDRACADAVRGGDSGSGNAAMLTRSGSDGRGETDEPDNHLDGVLAQRRDTCALHLRGKRHFATARMERRAGGTRSLALIGDDPDAPDPATPRMTWVHWVLYSLPTTTTGLAEAINSGALPSGTREGVGDDFGRTGYDGPCPPVGRHRYFHKLYALDTVVPD